MLFTPSIRSRVMGLVKARIKEAQKFHDAELKVMRERHEQVVKSVINSFTK